MDGIALSSERIVAAGVGVSDVGAMLSKEISAMGDLLAQISAGWQSESAAPRFAAAMHGYLDQATQLKAALLSHGATLLATGQRFAEAEGQLAQGLGGER